MCRKIKKLAWYTDEELWEQKLDYRFLELLVLFESKNDISDRLRKAGMTRKKYSEAFIDHLRPLLENPSKYLATYLKRIFHPELKEEEMSPEMAAYLSEAQERARAQISSRMTTPKSSSGGDWTMVTPVPHTGCHYNPPKRYSPVVPKEEEKAVEMQKTDLHYQQQILGVRREQELRKSFENLIPGYQRRLPSREQHRPRPSSGPSTTGVSRGAGTFERLSIPRKRLPSQPPCHASSCDAYRLGIPTKLRLGNTSRVAYERAKNLQRRKVKQCRDSDFIRLL